LGETDEPGLAEEGRADRRRHAEDKGSHERQKEVSKPKDRFSNVEKHARFRLFAQEAHAFAK